MSPRMPLLDGSVVDHWRNVTLTEQATDAVVAGVRLSVFRDSWVPSFMYRMDVANLVVERAGTGTALTAEPGTAGFTVLLGTPVLFLPEVSLADRTALWWALRLGR